MHVDRRETGAIEGRRHFQLTVDALLAQDRHAWTRADSHERRGDVCGRIVRQRHCQPLVVGIEQTIVFLLRAFRVVTQRLHAITRFRPGAMQIDTRLANEHLAAAVDLHLAAAIRRADQHSCDAGGLERGLDDIALRPANLHNGAQLLAEQRLHRTRRRTITQIADIERQAAPRGEGHFGDAGEQATVGTVMISQQHVIGGQLLNDLEECGQLRRRIDVGRLRPGGVEHLRQRRSAQPVAAFAKVDQQQVGDFAVDLELRRQRPPCIQHRRERTDDQ